MKRFDDRGRECSDSAPECDELNGEVEAFRVSVHAHADRPVFFWTRQRASILSRLSEPARPVWRRGLVWTAPLVVLACSLLFFVGESKAPPPDFAGGDDELLLIEVERALNRSCSEALDPAILVVDEIDRANRPSR